jgi:hypothetical protein
VVVGHISLHRGYCSPHRAKRNAGAALRTTPVDPIFG